MNRFRTTLSLAAALAVTAAAGGPRVAAQQPASEPLLTPAVRRAMEAVRPDALRAHVRYLADDLLEGRDTSSPGGMLAARYLASQFEQLGLKPVGDGGSYYQQVPFVRSRLDPDRSRLTIQAGSAETSLAFGTDFIGNGATPSAARLEAPLVFAGYGIRAPEYEYDDYKTLDVRDKLVVLLAGEPSSRNPSFFDGDKDTKHAAGVAKISLARSLGAAGVITVLSGSRATNYPWDALRGRQTASLLAYPGGGSDTLPALLLRETAAEKLFTNAPVKWEQVVKGVEEGRVPVSPLSASARLELAVERSDAPAPNVIGLIEGSDPELKKQVVIYTAHYDHVGRRGSRGDTIYNGAWDNASGTAGVLETARAFTALRPAPKRSVLFLLVTGEERGLWGSRWYTEHPLFPLESTAANINLDMTDIFGVPRELVPLGAEHSSLLRNSEVVARELGMKLGPDPTPELRTFVRSDQYSFVQVGVPSVFLRWANEYEDVGAEAAKAAAKQKLDTIYHKPADEYDPSWSWEGMRRHTQAAFLLGLHVAEQPEMPSWNADSSFNKPRGPRRAN